MAGGKEQKNTEKHFLTQEQENLLELYLQRLDTALEGMKASEKVQVEIETEHLKKILHT